MSSLETLKSVVQWLCLDSLSAIDQLSSPEKSHHRNRNLQNIKRVIKKIQHPHLGSAEKAKRPLLKILFAGSGRDYDLLALARLFRIELIDMDVGCLIGLRNSLPSDLKRYVDFSPEDITGGSLIEAVGGIRNILNEGLSAQTVLERVMQFFNQLKTPTKNPLQSGSPDFVVSTMGITQLTPFLVFRFFSAMKELFSNDILLKYPEEARRALEAFDCYRGRLQSAHAAYLAHLAASGSVVYFVSDVKESDEVNPGILSHPMIYDDDGNALRHLRDYFNNSEVLLDECPSWIWDFKQGKGGHRMLVEAVILSNKSQH